MGRMYGYARVSTREQNLDRQLDALEAFGVEARNVFADKASGADFERPEYRRMKGRLREGDVVAVGSIDRLGRDYGEILAEWRDITSGAGADIVVLDMPLLDTRAGVDGVTGQLISDIVLQLLSYVAQIERERIRKRQAEGIASARERGVQFGRPRKEIPPEFPRVRELYRSGELSRAEAASFLGVSERTFARWLKAEP